MRYRTISLVIMFFTALLGGCATLSEPECRNADWYTIGMEDGMNGLLTSRIGEHRRACSKYDITPDITAYQQGHAEGVTQFCTEANGFALGDQGGYYNGVCPPGLEESFLRGYRIGGEFYALRSEIERSSETIYAFQDRIEELDEELDRLENILVNDRTTRQERKKLLDRIKEKQAEIGELDSKILDLERHRAVLENEYAQLQMTHRYQSGHR